MTRYGIQFEVPNMYDIYRDCKVPLTALKLQALLGKVRLANTEKPCKAKVVVGLSSRGASREYVNSQGYEGVIR